MIRERGLRTATAAIAALVAVNVASPAAGAAKSCEAPDGSWEHATPAEAGMDAAKLQEALDYGSANLSFAVRVFRHGCLVGEDREAPINRLSDYESYSMAKSVTALMFGRAMTLGLISPDDRVGALVPEASHAHGSITIRDLLTMSSGLRWNGMRDYNVFPGPKRVHDALTLDAVREPGTYFEYAQSPVTLLAEAVARAAGEDAMTFIRRELTEPLGIRSEDWRWTREPGGQVYGFWGVQMRPDDWGKLGELMRRGGVWRGRRLLSEGFVRRAITPSSTNGCYGWLIWVNESSPCIGARVGEREIRESRMFPPLPANLFSFNGLFGQVVSVFPSQGVVVVRVGQDPAFIGNPAWEYGLYVRVLSAITDQRIDPPEDPPQTVVDRRDSDYGFGRSISEPDQYIGAALTPPPLPAAGPERARAAQLSPTRARVGSDGTVTVRVFCPAPSPHRAERACEGSAQLTGARKRLEYRIAPGARKHLRFSLSSRRLRAQIRRKSLELGATAINKDSAGGTPARESFTVLRPKSTGAR